MPKRTGSSSASAPEISGTIMQFKVWLLGLSPMVWRRVHVPATFTLRQLHGVIQVAMGWEGVHLFQFRLRAIRYGSWEVSARSPEITLESLRLRKGARFAYEYDLNIPWHHEIRLEERLEPVAKRAYPFCVEGHEACPPEDCGGPSGFLARRDAWLSDEGLEDLAAVADFVDQVVLKGRRDLLKDEALIEEMRVVSERFELRHSWQGQPFSRKAVNARLKNGDHLTLMHQRC